MSQSSVEAHIETLKELWLTDNDLGFLREVEPTLLARITAEVEAAARRNHDDQRRIYEGMARATRFIPNFVIGKLSGSMSPYVLARVTEYLEPKASAALSRAYDPALVAEISLHMSASAAAAIAAHTEVGALATVTMLLAKKGLVRRLGEVSDALDEQLLEQLVRKIGDPERIASVAAHMTALDKLRSVAQRLDGKLRQAVVRVLEQQGYTATAAAMAG